MHGAKIKTQMSCLDVSINTLRFKKGFRVDCMLKYSVYLKLKISGKT